MGAGDRARYRSRAATGGDAVKSEPTDHGNNRTGIATARRDARRTWEGAPDVDARAPYVGNSELERVRVELSRSADPVGTMPPTDGVIAAAREALDAARGR